MTPWKLERLVQRCGKWLYFADQGFGKMHPPPERLWFAPSVLTPFNPDKSSPHIPLEDAIEVFSSLEKRVLIARVKAIHEQNGQKYQIEAFIVNHDLDIAWQHLVTQSGFWNMRASPVLTYAKEQKWGLILLLFLAGAIAAGLCKEVGEKLGDDIYPYLKALFTK